MTQKCKIALCVSGDNEVLVCWRQRMDIGVCTSRAKASACWYPKCKRTSGTVYGFVTG